MLNQLRTHGSKFTHPFGGTEDELLIVSPSARIPTISLVLGVTTALDRLVLYLSVRWIMKEKSVATDEENEGSLGTNPTESREGNPLLPSAASLHSALEH